jgi:hypothetical protein
MTNITQDEHGTITISLPDAGLEAHMSPEVFDILAQQEATETRQRGYGDTEPVTMTPEQIACLVRDGGAEWHGEPLEQLPAETKLRFKGGLWRDYEPAPTKITTPNQRKRWRKRMSR